MTAEALLARLEAAAPEPLRSWIIQRRALLVPVVEEALREQAAPSRLPVDKWRKVMQKVGADAPKILEWIAQGYGVQYNRRLPDGSFEIVFVRPGVPGTQFGGAAKAAFAIANGAHYWSAVPGEPFPPSVLELVPGDAREHMQAEGKPSQARGFDAVRAALTTLPPTTPRLDEFVAEVLALETPGWQTDPQASRGYESYLFGNDVKRLDCDPSTPRCTIRDIHQRWLAERERREAREAAIAAEATRREELQRKRETHFNVRDWTRGDFKGDLLWIPRSEAWTPWREGRFQVVAERPRTRMRDEDSDFGPSFSLSSWRIGTELPQGTIKAKRHAGHFFPDGGPAVLYLVAPRSKAKEALYQALVRYTELKRRLWADTDWLIPNRDDLSAEMRRLELWLKDHPEHQDLTIAGQFHDSGGLGIRTPHLVTAP